MKTLSVNEAVLASGGRPPTVPYEPPIGGATSGGGGFAQIGAIGGAIGGSALGFIGGGLGGAIIGGVWLAMGGAIAGVLSDKALH
jgi:hypothetical protein